MYKLSRLTQDQQINDINKKYYPTNAKASRGKNALCISDVHHVNACIFRERPPNTWRSGDGASRTPDILKEPTVSYAFSPTQ